MTAVESSNQNFFSTTLTSGIGPTSTIIPLDDLGNLTSPCYLVIDPESDTNREVIYADGAFTGSAVVLQAADSAHRGLPGSVTLGTGISHNAGVVVESRPLAQHLEDIHDRVDVHVHDGTTDDTQIDTADLLNHNKAAHDALGIDASTLTGHSKALHDALALDHGLLTGLADDDHTNLLNDVRHDVVARHPVSVLGDGSGLGLRNVQVYVAGATWTKPSWLRYAHVVAVGGGGGGGGSQTTTAAQASAGDGGSAGWVCEGSFAAGTLGATETVTIGAAGSGGAASNNGTDGGASSFGAHVLAPGGLGGATRAATSTDSYASDTATVGNGTAAGTIQRTGQAGEGAVRLGTSPVAKNGRGGSSPYGAGGRSTGALSTGDNGTGKGAGGAGGHSGYGNAGRAGGNGTAGLVIVFEYA